MLAVSLLPKKQQHKIPRHSSPNVVHQHCREYFDCSEILCPAYNTPEQNCWLLPNTFCSGEMEGDFYHKISTCLTCSYFQEKGRRHAGGWDVFLADHVQRYIFNVLEQIYQKEESFVEILNRIPDGLFTTDKELRITYFNPAAEKITGFLAADAVGMYCRDVFKNTICETDCALKRACESGGDIHNREYVITTIEGHQIPIICSTSAFRDGAGKIIGGLEIFKDVTEIHRLQQAIVKSERKYRRVFEGSHDMIYTTNNQGRILEINQAGVDLLGYRNKAEVLALDHARRFYKYPADRDRFIRRINIEGFVKDYEVDFVTKNGAVCHVLLSSRKYENPQTQEIEYEGIIKDITKRKQTEQIIRQRNLELSILNSVAVAINLTMDTSQILNVTLKNVMRSLKIWRGGVFLMDAPNHTARLEACAGLPPQARDFRNTVIFKDDELGRHLIGPGGTVTPEPAFPIFKARYQTEAGGLSPWLSCVLITFKGKSVGFLALDLPAGRLLSNHEYHHLGSLGNFLGGAIENTRMMRTIQRHQQELSRLNQMLFLSQEEERRRIARELHDEAGQALMAVKLSLDRLEQRAECGPQQLRTEIEAIRQQVQHTSSEIRSLAYRLHPTLLADLGLEPALNLYFKEMAHRSSIAINFRMVGYDQRLHPNIETILYRFSQETFTNTLKHAAARHFKLAIIKSYPKIIFSAEDDGRGFDGRIGNLEQRCLGLIGMRERAQHLGGVFKLLSQPGRGTRIRIEIPFDKVSAYARSD